EAQALDDPPVEILFLRAHSADIEGQVLFHGQERRGEIVLYAHAHGRQDFEAGLRVRERLSEQIEALRRHEHREPAIELARSQFDVLRPLGAQKHRNVPTQRMHNACQRFAEPEAARPAIRQLVLPAFEAHGLLAREDRAEDRKPLARALEGFRERLSIPALYYLRTRHAHTKAEPAV